jgi:hypothetical protein
MNDAKHDTLQDVCAGIAVTLFLLGAIISMMVIA